MQTHERKNHTSAEGTISLLEPNPSPLLTVPLLGLEVGILSPSNKRLSQKSSYHFERGNIIKATTSNFQQKGNKYKLHYVENIRQT